MPRPANFDASVAKENRRGMMSDGWSAFAAAGLWWGIRTKAAGLQSLGFW